MVASVYFSLTDYKIVVSSGLHRAAELHRPLPPRPAVHPVALVTLRYTVLFVVLVQLVSLPLAVLLTQKVRGIAVFRTLFYLPVVVPVVATALLWRYLFNKEYGPDRRGPEVLRAAGRQLAGITRLGAGVAGHHQRLGWRAVHHHLRGGHPAHPGAAPRGCPDRRREQLAAVPVRDHPHCSRRPSSSASSPASSSRSSSSSRPSS